MSKAINGLNILVSELNHTQFAMFYDFVYDNLYTRYIGLFLGVVAAYLYVFKLDEMKAFFHNKRRNLALLLAALVILVLAFLEPYLLPKELKLAKLIEGNFLFSLAICYIILAVSVPRNQPASILSRFLGLRFFTPIARISYSAYLFHVPVIFIVYSLLLHRTETPFELILLGSLAAIPLTLLVSALCFIFIEQTFRVTRTTAMEK
jgi:peptidoglycan/LPS O-acetylase OafA/YrhL